MALHVCHDSELWLGGYADRVELLLQLCLGGGLQQCPGRGLIYQEESLVAERARFPGTHVVVCHDSSRLLPRAHAISPSRQTPQRDSRQDAYTVATSLLMLHCISEDLIGEGSRASAEQRVCVGAVVGQVSIGYHPLTDSLKTKSCYSLQVVHLSLRLLWRPKAGPASTQRSMS